MHALKVLAITRSVVAQEIYLRNGRDFTRPVTIHAMVNERCNCRCRHCELWRMDEYVPELSIEQWKRALMSLREFAGPFSLNFSGGEPFAKKGFVELIGFCAEQEIQANVTTNGSLFNENNIHRIVAAKPWSIEITVVSHLPTVHDTIRNRKGLLKQIVRNIALIRREQSRQNRPFPIIIKPTIMSVNFRTLPETVNWALASGADAVSFQPLGRWSKETYDELWIGECDLKELERIMGLLIEMKQNGAPILNSESMLRLVTAGFKGEKDKDQSLEQALPCRIGLKELYIRPDGEVRLCPHFPGIGNITTHTARELWKSPRAKMLRAATVKCDKHCLFARDYSTSLTDRISEELDHLTGLQKRDNLVTNSHG